jgi:aminoglycoside 3-N-acetyltransferase
MPSLTLARLLPSRVKDLLRPLYASTRLRFVRAFRSYDVEALSHCLLELGIAPGDTLIMHSSFKIDNGFLGTPQQVIDAILRLLGDSGHLIMMSMGYTGSALSYLSEDRPFDPKRTVSRMGLMTEIFRRRRGVVRSLNPVHPILAKGPKAEWIVEDHERLIYSCGDGSPFERALEMDAKVLFYDVEFLTCTFLHFLEHRFRRDLGVQVYYPSLVQATVLDSQGNQREFKSYVFDPETVRARDEIWLRLEDLLLAKNMLVTTRLGNTRLALVHTKDLYRQATALIEAPP